MAKKVAKNAVAQVNDYAILLSPVISEKSALVGESGQVVTFRVDPRATKTAIRTAVAPGRREIIDFITGGTACPPSGVIDESQGI